MVDPEVPPGTRVPPGARSAGDFLGDLAQVNALGIAQERTVARKTCSGGIGTNWIGITNTSHLEDVVTT